MTIKNPIVLGVLIIAMWGAATNLVQAQAVSASPGFVQPGQPVTVTYSGAPGFTTDWIGVFPLSAPMDRSWLSWQYTEGKGSGTMTFKAPDQPGSYNFRLFKQDSYDVLAVSNAIEVGATPPPELPDDGKLQLAVSPVQVRPGETIQVRYSGAPGNKTDWVGIYPADAPPDRSWLSWQYTEGNTFGTLQFKAPDKPGRYNFRLFKQDAYDLLATSITVTVLDGATPTKPRTVCRITNYAGDTKHPHEYRIDFANCTMASSDGAGTPQEVVRITLKVCRPDRVVATVVHKHGYVIDYDWVFSADGRTINGAYRDSGGNWGPSFGQASE